MRGGGYNNFTANDPSANAVRGEASSVELSRSAALAILAALVSLGAAARIAASAYSPWFDEWASAYFAGLPLDRLWGAWMVRETNPPLYYTLLKLWIGVGGSGVMRMRMLSVLAGSLGIAAVAAIGWTFFGRRCAIIAAILCASSAQHIYFSTAMRGYVFAFLAASVAIYGAMLICRKDADAGDLRKGVAIYAGGSVAAIYLHTTMILWPVAATPILIACAWLDRAAARKWIAILAASLCILLGGLWWIQITAHQIIWGTQSINWIPKLGLVAHAQLVLKSVFLARYPGIGAMPTAIVLASAALAGALTGRSRNTAVITGLFTSSLAVFFIVGLVKPVVLDRTVFWMSAFAIVLAAAGLSRIRRPRIGIGLALVAGGCLAWNAYLAEPGFVREDWPAFLQAQAASSHPVLVLGKSGAIIAEEACHGEFGGRCPIRFVAIDVAWTTPQPPVWGDDYSGPTIRAPGATDLHPDTPVYLLENTGGSPLFLMQLPANLPEARFGPDMRVVGPVPAENAVFKARGDWLEGHCDPQSATSASHRIKRALLKLLGADKPDMACAK